MIARLVTYSIFKNGERVHEHEETKVIRMVPGELRPERYHGGIIYNWPYVWDFSEGKMAVGMGCPQHDHDDCIFFGHLDPDQQYSFPIGNYRDWKKEDQGRVDISWENVEIDLEIKDGKLMSISDQEEFILPKEVHAMHYQAFLSAPSLRKITLHAGITDFSDAIEEFHKKQHVKLDVDFEGNLQQWFDTAAGLYGHIGRLVIQGKESDLYETKDLVIPEGISRIGKKFFQYNEVLRSVVLPEEVVEIGDDAFAYCKQLQSVRVMGPATVGQEAFVSCKNLSEIYLADGVVSLKSGCFDFLTQVESIFIPLSVTSVDCICGLGHEDNHRHPKFYCATPSKPLGWSKDWNLSYSDPLFGYGHGHDFYHPAYWGMERTPMSKSLQNNLL